MSQHESLQSAVNDLATIRRAIEKAEGQDPSIPAHRIAVDAGLIFQGLCLLVALALLAFELVSDREMTQTMMLSVRDQELGLLGLAQVAMTGLTLVMCIYFLAWRAARHSGQTFDDYLARNFQYLKNLSLVSDLLVKFIPLSLLVLGAHSEWIAPLLSLYIADYLVQGRFFSFPTRASLVFGVVSVMAAGTQYLAHSAQLLWPLVHFSVVTAMSLFFLVGARRETARAEQAA
jgi:hypothetical protein